MITTTRESVPPKNAYRSSDFLKLVSVSKLVSTPKQTAEVINGNFGDYEKKRVRTNGEKIARKCMYYDVKDGQECFSVSVMLPFIGIPQAFFDL